MALVKDLNIIFSSITTGKSVVINYDQSSQALTSNKLFELIAEKEGLKLGSFQVSYNGKNLHTKSSCDICSRNDEDTIHVTLSIGVEGGKGGFGSMLRAIGAQIEKTTNKEACRDLSGRRIRDVNIERRLQNWVTKAAERKKEQMKRKKEKLERLRRVPKFEFKDDEYFKVRSEIPEKIDAALDYALHKSKNKSATVTSDCNNVETSSTVRKGAKKVEKPMKRKHLMKLGLAKRSRLWVGDDLEVSDEESCPPNEETNDERTIDKKVAEDVSLVKEVGPTCPIRIEDLKTSNLEQTVAVAEVPIKDPEVVQIKKEIEPKELVLEDINSKEELISLGLDRLMSALKFLGMKCGGTLEQRADRLLSVRGLQTSKIPKNLLAPKSKK